MLRNLIVAGHIAPGDVDERSIEDVHPSDLKPYTQCHFFAGVGVWSHALRRAGWADDRPVWTGSCPCQPFSSAGQGAGFDDQRHLWPHFFHFIEQRRPSAIFGEQVASRDADPWIDLVQDDLEGLGYGVGAVPFPSAGVGAPHIRDRLYWMAYANGSTGRQGCANLRGRPVGSNAQPWTGLGGGSMLDRLGHTDCQHSGRLTRASDKAQGEACLRSGCDLPSASGSDGDMGNTQRARLALSQRIARISGGASGADAGQAIERAGIHPPTGPGPTNSLWSTADWLLCRDGKWRPVEPGTFPLAHGAPARVGRLRAYGNAINAEQARVFIEAGMSCMP
ncbi:DNA cytosine methyltransferase [Comamonas testosteroni]|uniref:DNA cytosine methyltransferase n=1 Tax=Comamonas testosteroni TaxID=285 RepID=UPI001EE71B95|nr:DNA cytosine methyltransferase [Comamonas testosteroni]